MKKQKQKRSSLITSLLVVAILLLLGQLYLDYSLIKRPVASDTTIAQLITHAIENLYKPAAVDPKTGYSYIPELRLVLPVAATNAAHIRYTYNADSPDDSRINLTTNGLLSSGEVKLLTAGGNPTQSPEQQQLGVFKQVPSLQACARGLQLYERPQKTDDGKQLSLTLTLKDKRTFYGYTESACKEDMTILLDTVRQAQSY